MVQGEATSPGQDDFRICHMPSMLIYLLSCTSVTVTCEFAEANYV